MAEEAVVVIDGESFAVGPEAPLVFGRGDAPGVVGLDPSDMGISAQAGAVERQWGVWWVVNRSTKRRLLLDVAGQGPPQRLDCGQRYAITVPRLTVLIPGAVLTHRLDVILPDSDLLADRGNQPSSGTLAGGQVQLTERDRDALVALFGGYLEEFPRRTARPRSYQEAANLLGDPWTKVSVRKQVERLKERLARAGVYFEGAQANYELADYLLGEGLLATTDLTRLKGRR